MSEDFTRQVLQVAANAPGPMGTFDVIDAIEPGADNPAQGTPAWAEMDARRMAVARTIMELGQQGLLEFVAGGGPTSDQVTISATGNKHLAQL
jgi:hypothetical protein